MYKEDSNKILNEHVKIIRKIKKHIGNIQKEYNIHFFKSLIGNKSIGGVRWEIYGYWVDRALYLAQSSTSIKEYRQLFGEKCCFPEYHSLDKKGNLDDNCECGYYYRKLGGDSFYLTLRYEKTLQELKTQLKIEQEKYQSTLKSLKSLL